MIPLLDLKAQYLPLREDILAAIARVCDSQRFILGPEVDALEKELAAIIGVEHAIGVSSGTDALIVSMMALGIGPGDEVITSTFSFFATAGSIVRLGAVPRFVDIDPETFNLDPAAVARAVTPKTKAILPVHLYGLCADMDPILEIAAEKKVPVIEDACQAIGSKYKGRPARSRPSRSSRARTSTPSVTPVSSRPTTPSWRRRSSACACTGWSPSTTTTRWAAISVWTRFRRRFCG